MVRQGALVLLMIGLAPACGRSAMDEGPAPAVSGGAGTRVPPDLPPPAFACADLQPLAEAVLTPRHVVRVLFAPDRSSLVLQVKGEGLSGSSIPDDLLLVRLPSGEVSSIISSIASTSRWIASPEWLQPGATLLVGAVRDGKIDLVVVGSDGSGLRTLVQGVCDYVAAPDGSRVYVTHDCDQYRHGAIDVVDVASGASTRLAAYGELRTSRGNTVSPDGRWAAFQSFIPLNGGPSQWVLAVGSADGQVETLVSQPGASDQGFVSDRLLLFQTRVSSSEIRGHVPGTGDTSYLVAADRNTGGFGYQVSPDGKWLLGANASQTNASLCVTKLYAIRLDGTGELLLASDPNNCLPHPQMVSPRDFAFSAHGRVIYSTSDFGVATVGLDGGKPTVLSDGAYFLEAPWLDQVALFEPTSGGSAGPRLRLVDLESGTDVFAYDSDGYVWAIGFPPDGRGLVFTEDRSSGPSRLRYASADRSLVLGEWQTTQFVLDPWSNTYPLATYPLDPTGCFTVFDTDLTPGPGTRLAILPQ